MTLLKEIRTYSFGSDKEARDYLSKLQKDYGISLTKYQIELKEKKAKGEVIADQTVLTATITYEKVFDYLTKDEDDYE